MEIIKKYAVYGIVLFVIPIVVGMMWTHFADAQLWNLVKSGAINAYSIFGKGKRIPVRLSGDESLPVT